VSFLHLDLSPLGRSVQKEEVDVPQAWGVVWCAHMVGGFGVVYTIERFWLSVCRGCEERENRVRYLSFSFVLVLESEEKKTFVMLIKETRQ
jgi:hypothetical protein